MHVLVERQICPLFPLVSTLIHIFYVSTRSALPPNLVNSHIGEAELFLPPGLSLRVLLIHEQRDVYLV